MLLDHTLGIFTNPDREWQKIREEKRSKTADFFTHVPLLALIPTISFYFGVTQSGWTITGDKTIYLTNESALVLSIASYFTAMLGVWIFGEFINWMAATYSDAPVDPHHGMATAIYVATPLFLAGFAGFYPVLWFNATVIVVAACYSVYLLYEGVPIIMNIDKSRAFMYSSSIITVALVLLVTMRIGSVLIWAMVFGPEYID